MTAARRVAAILAANVVGTSRLSARRGRRRPRGARVARAATPIVRLLGRRLARLWAALAEARRLNPKLSVKWMTKPTPNLPVVFDGLRKVGLPEE
jgi:hypothetical protein